MTELLEVNKLNAWYGATQALHGISFSLQAGRITAILGANGAGKTSTLRALCQTVRSSGSIRFEGRQLLGQATENIVRAGGRPCPRRTRHLWRALG
jgi:branched-chain amino acid transport system ATP-binding protein